MSVKITIDITREDIIQLVQDKAEALLAAKMWTERTLAGVTS